MDLVRDKVIKEKYPSSAVVEMFECGMLRKDHPLQRKADQHDKETVDGFIATVIKQEDFDSFKLCEELTPNGVVVWIIDGIQRLTEIMKFKNGVFKLGKKVELPIIKYQVAEKDENGNVIIDKFGCFKYKVEEFDLRGKGYNDLPRELKLKFDNCPVDLVKHLDCTPEEIAYHMRRYNHQKSLNTNQTGITYTEKCAAWIKKISLHNRFFLDCGKFTTTEKKNGTFERIVMDSVMAIFHMDSWNKNIKDVGIFLNSNATEEEFRTVDDYFTRLTDIAEDKYKDYFNKKNTFIFLSLFDRFSKLDLEDSKFEEFMDAFGEELHSKEVNGISFDMLDNERCGTKDKNIIIKKIEILYHLMKEYFHLDTSIEETQTMDEFVSEVVEIAHEDVMEDIDLYEEDLNDMEDRVVPFESKLRHDNNRMSMVAIVAYAYKNDLDIEEWLAEYSKKNNTYLKDQKKNFEIMIKDLERYNNAKEKVA